MLLSHFRGAMESLNMVEVLKELGFVNKTMDFANPEEMIIDLT